MPGLMIDKEGKAIILLGREIFSLHDDIVEAFLTFLAMYYVLDVDYPQSYAMAFSIIHRYIFNDNRVCESVMELFDSAWEEISKYLYCV